MLVARRRPASAKGLYAATPNNQQGTTGLFLRKKSLQLRVWQHNKQKTDADWEKDIGGEDTRELEYSSYSLGTRIWIAVTIAKLFAFVNRGADAIYLARYIYCI